MAKKRIKSRNIKSKSYPIPHNNRADNGGRMVRRQLIMVKDKADPTKVTKKTIFHMNYSIAQQGRIHLIKDAIANDDSSILKKLSPSEKKLYDQLLLEKQIKEKEKDGEV